MRRHGSIQQMRANLQGSGLVLRIYDGRFRFGFPTEEGDTFYEMEPFRTYRRRDRAEAFAAGVCACDRLRRELGRLVADLREQLIEERDYREDVAKQTMTDPEEWRDDLPTLLTDATLALETVFGSDWWREVGR